MAEKTFHSITLPGQDTARVPLTAAEFSTSVAYKVKDYCTYQGKLYRCTTAHAAGVWNAAHFTATDVDAEFDRKLDIPASQATAPANPRVGDLWIDNDENSPIYNVDASPTLNSTNAVQSGGTKVALNSIDSRKVEHGIITGDFSASVDYRVGDLVFHTTTANGITTRTLYRCITDHNAAAWTAAHFTATTLEVELQRVRDNEADTDMIGDLFGMKTTYAVGDYCIYNDNLYRCIQAVDNTGVVTPAFDPDDWTQVALANDVSDLNSAINVLEDTIVYPFVELNFIDGGSGYINSTNGEIGPSSVTDYTDYIDIAGCVKIKYKRQGTTSTASTITSGIAFYDESRVYISGVAIASGQAEMGYIGFNTVTVPNDARYVRCGIYADTTTYGNFEIYGAHSIISELKNLEAETERIVKGTNNLWQFSNTAARTNRGVDVEFPDDSTIKIVGTSSSVPASFAACGSSTDKKLPAGTYVLIYNTMKHNQDMTGTVEFLYSYQGLSHDQTTITPNVPFTTTESSYVLIRVVINKTYNATYTIKLMSMSDEQMNAGFYPTTSPVDYIARNMVQKTYEVPVVPGAIHRDTGSTTFTYETFWNYRTTPLLSVSGDTVISIDPSDAFGVASFNIYEYGESMEDSITYIQAIRELSFYQNKYLYRPSSSNVKYLRVTLVMSASTNKKFRPLKFTSPNGGAVCKNPNITDGSKIQLSYIVDGNTYTSGQLLLPPNYSIHRKACPLVVILHGTSSMNTWAQEIGTNSGTSTRYLLNYLTNEGFAVFDCYCFTSKYYSANYQNQAAPLPVFLQAYTAGIKYVCEYFNVDIDNVCFYAMSAGGNLGQMLLHSFGDIKPRAVAMLCPSTGFASTIFRTFFLDKSMRTLIVNYLGLSGETGASTFINTSSGLDNATARAFVEDHLNDFAGLICGAIGAHGATFEQQYEWMTTGVTTLPQWMTDLSLPGIASGWTTAPATGIPELVNHPELSAFSPVPVKFWQSFDDVNVSGHANYTIYTWLKNGGSNAQWRTLPDETGGHHAVDTDPNALKSSGTTRLGISYSNIATAYVEMADFFYKNMSQ